MSYDDFIKRATDKKGLDIDWKRIKSLTPTDLTHHKICIDLCKIISFDSMIDAGPGSIGSEAWSIDMLKPECKIYGFEPGDARYDLLKKADYPGILSKMAISSFEGDLEGGMGFEEGRSDFCTNANDVCYDLNLYKKATVKCTTIDTIIESEELENVFIWADIEGAELELLKGAKQSFEQKKIVGFWTELNFDKDPAQANFCSYKEVINLLNEYGFRTPSKVRPVTSRDVYNADYFGTHADYLFLPQEHPIFGTAASSALKALNYRRGR
tara:strand:+ start:2486 stop:3292 length:807 start_codon:yes stop_codon:yes gene_type:complete